MAYFVYILECANKAYYTGWSTDPIRRLKQHNKGQGAKYTRLNGPSSLVYCEEQPDRASAQKREAQIKTWDHNRKQKLVESQPFNKSED